MSFVNESCLKRVLTLILRFLHLASEEVEGTCDGLQKEE